jgi:hypothetical protein
VDFLGALTHTCKINVKLLSATIKIRENVGLLNAAMQARGQLRAGENLMMLLARRPLPPPTTLISIKTGA